MYQFGLEYLKHAVQALHRSNAEDYFKIYLILKRFGLRYRPSTPVVIDTRNTEDVMNRLYYVRELGEMNDNSPIYDPMRNATNKYDASRSIIQTNIKKISQGGLAMGKVDWLNIVQRDDRKWLVSFSPMYPSGLGADAAGFAIRNTQITIPTPEFLTWFYRYETFEEIPAFSNVFSHMISEMNFTEEEVLILFDARRDWEEDTFAQEPLDEKALARFILEEAGLGAEALHHTPRTPFSRTKFRRIIGAFQTMEAENNWWLPTHVVDEAREILHTQKALLLVGAPATGKTRLAKQLAQELVGSEAQIHEFQFHSSYTYEDFIEGLVPQTNEHGDLIFAPVEKRFLQILQAAQDGTSQVVIIDEMNRADISKVFGEALQLLELDYRGIEHAIPRLYDQQQLIWIPSSLYVIATMNDIDRSTYEVDFALRRRFGQVYVKPEPQMLMQMLRTRGSSDEELIRICASLLTQVQQFYPLGHAYFKDLKNREDLPKIYRRSIRPAIKEYLGDYRLEEMQEVDMLFKQAYEAETFDMFIGASGE